MSKPHVKSFKKSCIIIKTPTTSLSEFYDFLEIYRCKYPSHFGYMSYSISTKTIKKMDSTWWNYGQFKKDLVRNTEWNDFAVVLMTAVSSEYDLNASYRNEVVFPQRMFLLDSPSVTSSFSTNCQRSKLIVFTGDLYSGENYVTPKGLIEYLQREKVYDDFKKDPHGFIMSNSNGIKLVKDMKCLTFTPGDELSNYKLQWIKASDKDSGMYKLDNNIITSDLFPSAPLSVPFCPYMIDNRADVSMTRNDPSSVLSPRLLFDHITVEWENVSSFDEVTMKDFISDIRKASVKEKAAKVDVPVLQFPNMAGAADEYPYDQNYCE